MLFQVFDNLEKFKAKIHQISFSLPELLISLSNLQCSSLSIAQQVLTGHKIQFVS